MVDCFLFSKDYYGMGAGCIYGICAFFQALKHYAFAERMEVKNLFRSSEA
jgi:hypothetical protein